MLALGSYPEVSLATARDRRDQAKKLIAAGTDPSEKRKLDKVASAIAARNTFGAIASEHISKLEKEGAAPSTLTKTRWLLEDLAGPLAKRPITAITPAEILVLLQRIEKSGRRDTARRLRGAIGSVFTRRKRRYAMLTKKVWRYSELFARCERYPFYMIFN